VKIENEGTFVKALENKINLFLGSGFSVLALDKNGRKLPIGQSLATELREHFDLKNMETLDLQKLCTVIKATKREQLHMYLKERFTINEIDKRYKILDRLAIDTIFTTNIDNVIHKAFEVSASRYLNDLDFHGPVYNDKSAIDLVMLHGSVLNDDRPLRFGTLEIASSFGADPNRWRDLQDRIKRSPTLFWGYSVEDPATLEALTPSINKGGQSQSWILVHPSQKETSIIEYYKALNLHIIEGDTEEFLNYLVEEFSQPEHVPVITHLDVRALFPNESIPHPSEVFQRPITHFLRGDAPVWSDIFSNLLYKTSHYLA